MDEEAPSDDAEDGEAEPGSAGVSEAEGLSGDESGSGSESVDA